MPTKKGEQKTGDHVKFKTAIVLSWCMVTTWEKLSYLVFQKWIWIVPVKYHQKNLVFFKQKSYLRVSTDAMRRKCRTVIYQLLIMMCQAVVIPYMLPGSNRDSMKAQESAKHSKQSSELSLSKQWATPTHKRFHKKPLTKSIYSTYPQ